MLRQRHTGETPVPLKKLLAAVFLLLSTVVIGLAFQKPTFSGEWVMDHDRSFGMPPKMDQIMKVSQAGDQITLETRLITSEGEDTIKDAYIIDGKERDFTPQNGKGPIPNSKGKRTANWLPNGKGIAVDEETTTETPKGVVTGKLTRKWTINSAGELVIDFYVDNANLSYETKRVFKKK